MGGRPRLRCVPAISNAAGFTLVELMVVVAIIGILGAIAIPNYIEYVQRARMTKALSDLRTMDRLIQYHIANMDALPTSLADIGEDTRKDPWGNPYRYLLIDPTQTGLTAQLSPDPLDENLPFLGFLDIHTVTVSAVTGKPKSPPPGQEKKTDPPPGEDNTQVRKDGSGNAINLDYDLYSMGPDGSTDPSLSSKPGYDDIIRGSSGGYFGPANNY